MRALHAVLAAVSLGIVVGVTLWEADELISPGPLHGSHELAELQGRAGCTACHGARGTEMAGACLQCHRAITGQVENARGLHGALGGADARACAACHREHTAGRLPLVTAASFARAGVAGVARYDHRHVEGYALTGRHAELACTQCHAHAEAAVLAAGEQRYLGASQDCRTCHDDPHRGDLGASCASCHGQEQPFERVASFAHDPAFPLEGGHAALACAACHERDTPHAVAALRGKTPEPRACADCHDSDHQDAFLAGVSASTDTPPRATCGLCHDPQDGAFASPAASVPSALHAASGFALDPPHADVACTACHAGLGSAPPAPAAGAGETEAGARFAARFPGRTPDACRACHADPHRGQFDAGATRGECLACHERTHFVPSAFDAERHERAGFALTGAHRAVACSRCHEARAGERAFVPTAQQCAACHRDVHGGRFDGSGLPAQIDGRRGCARCHDTASFAEARLPGADHGLWTDYELRGAHAAAACSDCHRRDPEAGGRGFGAASRACADCHRDPHAGQFRDRAHNDCGRCHGEERPFAHVHFDHARDARFALDARHRSLDCSACHRSFALPGGGAVIRYRPLGTQCADCHDSRRARPPASRGERG